MGTVTKTDDVNVATAPSFKPYARSLSHELRTPMHGVIGMLDVMHATVQESIESQPNPKIRNIFQTLKENIEVVQGTKLSICSQD
jgi:signal transduction histidine kinase